MKIGNARHEMESTLQLRQLQLNRSRMIKYVVNTQPETTFSNIQLLYIIAMDCLMFLLYYARLDLQDCQ